MSGRDDEDEALLERLGELVREEDEAMDALSERDPFGPLSPEEERALADGVLGRLGLAEDAAPTPASQRAPNVVPLAPRRRRVWVGVATAVAAAAAIALVMLPRGGPELPPYELIAPRPDASHRGPDAPVVEDGVYTLGRELEVVVRPAHRADGVSGRAFVEREDGELEALAVEAERVDGGALRFLVPTGDGTELAQPGTARLRFVVAPAGETITMRSGEDARASWQVLSWSPRLVEDAP